MLVHICFGHKALPPSIWKLCSGLWQHGILYDGLRIASKPLSTVLTSVANFEKVRASELLTKTV